MIASLQEPRVQCHPEVTFVSRVGESIWAHVPPGDPQETGQEELGLGTIAEETDPVPADWLDRLVDKLVSLGGLAPNWDSYGAPEIDQSVLDLAARLVLEELPHGMPEPLVNPTPAGGVQLEWHRRGADVEIELVPGEEDIVVYIDQAGQEDEDEGTLAKMRPLLERVGVLFAKNARD